MVSCNINEKIRVRLTFHGNMILDNYLKSLKTDEIPESLKPDCTGFRRFQLWEFMSIFGKEYYNGCTQIIENNQIVFCGCD